MCLRRCYFFPRRQFACAILNLPGKVISPPPALHYFLYRPLQRGFIHPLFSSAAPPLPFRPSASRSNYSMLFHAAETVREIYWPLSRRHLTRDDVANRSRAISHLLWLLCKADLSCLRAIFKLRAPKDLWSQGKFYYHRRPFV